MQSNVVVFGDSYSTFEGYIPEGNAVYYSENPRPETDVTKVEQTWWHQVVVENGWNLVLNDSWSGSTIGYTGWNGVDNSKTSSFIYRLRQLIARGFFDENKIDKVFVFGGTNDSWCNAPLGEITDRERKEEDFYSVLPAIDYYLYLLKATLPQAEIFCLINTEIKPEVVSCMKNACDKYGIMPVTFDSIAKRSGHPTIQGMKDIKNRVLSSMNP